MNQEVRDLGAVGGGRLALFDDEIAGVELCRQGLDRLHLAIPGIGQIERVGCGETFGGHEDTVGRGISRTEIEPHLVG